MEVDIEVDNGRLRLLSESVRSSKPQRPVERHFVPDIDLGPGWFDSSRALLTGLQVFESEEAGSEGPGPIELEPSTDDPSR